MFKLISIIETCKPLWDHRLPLGDRSENIKNNMWNEVFVQFNGLYTLECLKSTWKYIRERYTREKKPSASGSSGGTKKVWEHFLSLLFLDDVLLVQKRTIDNLTQESTSSNELNESTPSSKRSKRPTIEHYMGSLIDELKHSRPMTPTEPVLLAPEPPNEDHTFSLYLTNIMSEIPKQSKIKLQGKLIALVIEVLSK
ncbi:uncharacterized protein LOC111042257 [Myzus persicae]|uniref:uncharacterized protein LOC111042257 n=1 Tax=Myzus persicae TaxID=13164 RepID=UPI000B92FDF2|nr:uncharacterized protein LOC111042257 [Myzus persicae]